MKLPFFISRIPTRFDERKAAGAAGVLLQKAGGQMEYMRLLKLLYLADRESWKRFNRPITGDDYVSMDQGPVLSKTYNLIRQEGELGASDEALGPWARTVERVSRYDVKLSCEPDLGPLSEAEIQVLRETYDQYGNWRLWDLVDHLHKILKEWSNPKGSSIEISPEEILRALGKSERDIKEARQDAQERADFERLLGAN